MLIIYCTTTYYYVSLNWRCTYVWYVLLNSTCLLTYLLKHELNVLHRPIPFLFCPVTDAESLPEERLVLPVETRRFKQGHSWHTEGCIYCPSSISCLWDSPYYSAAICKCQYKTASAVLRAHSRTHWTTSSIGSRIWEGIIWPCQKFSELYFGVTKEQPCKLAYELAWKNGLWQLSI